MADRLHMTVAEVEQMSAREYAEWGVYLEVQAHREKHARKAAR